MKNNKEYSYKVCFISYIALFILTLLSITAKAQSGVSISLHQDIRLAIVGDEEHGYKAGTLDLLARFKMNGNQGKYGYFVVYPEFEYAEIDGIYKRYSVNVGYTLNKLIVDDAEIGVYLGWGWIDRYGKTFYSFGGGIEVSYKLTEKLKISGIGQLTERKELKFYWNETQTIKPSFLFGIEYKL